MAGLTGYTVSLIILAVATLAMIAVLLRRPDLAASAGGMVFAFFTFFLLPGVALLGGAAQHYEQAKTTEFCVSCHVNRPYEESLYIDDGRFLPAAHFQNRRVPAERACYACHSDYTMFGDVDDKIRGVRHVWHNVWGTWSEPVALYEPYENTACLACHAGARSYEEHPEHRPYLRELSAGSKSCVMCHNLVHEVDKLDRFGRWEPEGGE